MKGPAKEGSDSSETDQSNSSNTEDGSDNNRNQPFETYQEGTADNDGATSGTNADGDVAGYGELPEQQKVGE